MSRYTVVPSPFVGSPGKTPEFYVVKDGEPLHLCDTEAEAEIIEFALNTVASGAQLLSTESSADQRDWRNYDGPVEGVAP